MNEPQLYKAPFMTLAEIRARWPQGELRNNLITGFGIDITGHGGCIVSPAFYLANGQPFGFGYCSTGNVGYIIKRVAEMLDLFEDDPQDFVKRITNTPIRFYNWGKPGWRYMDGFCFGHFMEDRFVYARELVQTGLPLHMAQENLSER